MERFWISSRHHARLAALLYRAPSERLVITSAAEAAINLPRGGRSGSPKRCVQKVLVC